MKARFWGVRGSLPTPMTTASYLRKLSAVLAAMDTTKPDSPEAMRAFTASLRQDVRQVVGGNTSCVEFQAADHRRIICDAGSGIRELGHALVAEAKRETPGGKNALHILISHTHWDHIMGIPYCAPLYLPDWEIHFYGCHPDLQARLSNQHDPRHFPVPFEAFVPNIEIHVLTPGEPTEINGFRVTPWLMDHPGDSYSFRIEADDRAFVYGTDAAYGDEALLTAGKYAGADALIFDAMLSLEDATILKKDWGHSSPPIGVDVCARFDIPNLLLFHHDPDNADDVLYQHLEDARGYLVEEHSGRSLRIELAREGWEFDPARGTA